MLLNECTRFFSQPTVTESPAPSILPCDAVIVHRTKLYLNFAFVVIFEFVVLVMTFWKGVEQWRQCKSPVISTLYRDSILIFVCLFAISTTNLMLFLLANVSVFYDLLALSQRIIHAILSARVVLHLRIAASHKKIARLTTIAFLEPSDDDPMENIHDLDLDLEEGEGEEADDGTELASTSSRSSSISTVDSFQTGV